MDEVAWPCIFTLAHGGTHTLTHSHTLYLASSHANTLSCSLGLSLDHKHFATHYATRAYPQQASLFSISRTHTQPHTLLLTHTHTLFPPNISFYQPALSKCNHADPFKGWDPFLSLSLTHLLSLSLTYSLSRNVYTFMHANIYDQPPVQRLHTYPQRKVWRSSKLATGCRLGYTGEKKSSSSAA